MRQRCLAHRLRNLRCKASETQWPEIAIRARACYEAASPALTTLLRGDFVQAYELELPAVVKCFNEDFDACIAHLRFPLRHRKVIRMTNLLKRLFLETRRRTKVIPLAEGERRVLKLLYAAVVRRPIGGAGSRSASSSTASRLLIGQNSDFQRCQKYEGSCDTCCFASCLSHSQTSMSPYPRVWIVAMRRPCMRA